MLTSSYVAMSHVLLSILVDFPVKEVELSNVVNYEGCFRATTTYSLIRIYATLPRVKKTLYVIGTHFYFDLIRSHSSYQANRLNQLFSD